MTVGTKQEAARAAGKVVAFPLFRRAGAVRGAAAVLASKRSWRAADAWRNRLSGQLFEELAALGLSESEQDEEVGAFFAAVDAEIEAIFGDEYGFNEAH